MRAIIGLIVAIQDKLTVQNRMLRAMGLYLLVMYKTHIRPGEYKGLLRGQRVPPTQAAGKVLGLLAFLFHLTELGVPGNTNQVDASLVGETDRRAVKLFNRRKNLSGKDGKSLPFDLDTLLATFQLVSVTFHLDPFKTCLCAILHGRARDDLLLKERSVVEVKQLGRRAANSRLKRYGIRPRALSELAKVPTATIQFVKKSGKLLPEILAGRDLVTPPPRFNQSVEFNDRMQELFRK